VNWREITDVSFVDDGRLVVEVGPLLLILLGVTLVALLYRAAKWGRLLRPWEAVEANLRLGGIGSLKIRPNHDDVQVAHRAWVELATRKAGLPLDRENDVIVEIYDSWYELFGEMRRLAEEFPAQKLRADNSRKVVELIVEALNRGLRPHLTRWQARFRRWYDQAAMANPDMSPQEVQRLYPHYEELVTDLERVNGELLEYIDLLKALASGSGLSS
jgi:hypothetical protein